MVHCAVHIAARERYEKKKPPCPNPVQAMRLVLFVKLTCILNESASQYLDRLVSTFGAEKSACSRFDKFNHVKYTKTLSVRNPHTLFFAPFDHDEHRYRHFGPA